ncbi:hypothetical protein SteCoe_9002 [Stentor coeruleus]|uniref:Casein kinase I n=1 Tax=Stentor coeruleus TaxID=5963 RepID=A0A1R2CIS9_9CILI|nr:hypothetical protein SteCoe_9002 [Stentor coeruleus]
MLNSILGDRFEVVKKLHSNTFYKVYKANDLKTLSKVVIKCDRRNTEFSLIKYESEILTYLLASPGAHRILNKGEYKGRCYMILNYLGKSLNDKLKTHSNRISPGCALKITEELLLRIEYLHKAGFVHRDIKPEKILTGYGLNWQTLYVIGYRYAVRINENENVDHFNLHPENYVYSSLNSSNKIPYTRRDDLESIIYILIHLYTGSLPWLNTPYESEQEIKELKESISLGKLCKNLPIEILTMARYVRSLKHNEEPNYQMLRNSIKYLASKLKVNLIYDWAFNPREMICPNNTLTINKRIPPKAPSSKRHNTEKARYKAHRSKKKKSISQRGSDLENEDNEKIPYNEESEIINADRSEYDIDEKSEIVVLKKKISSSEPGSEDFFNRKIDSDSGSETYSPKKDRNLLPAFKAIEDESVLSSERTDTIENSKHLDIRNMKANKKSRKKIDDFNV